MGLVIYRGSVSPAVLTLPNGERLEITSGTQYELPLEVCAALLRDPSKWVAGNSETESFVPPGASNTIPYGPVSLERYAAKTVYQPGAVVRHTGSWYVARRATHDEAPDTSPTSWFSLGIEASTFTALGNVAGNTAMDFALATSFGLTFTGTTVLQPAKLPTLREKGLIYTHQDATGSHPWTVENGIWLGGTPSPPLTKEALVVIAYSVIESQLLLALAGAVA